MVTALPGRWLPWESRLGGPGLAEGRWLAGEGRLAGLGLGPLPHGEVGQRLLVEVGLVGLHQARGQVGHSVALEGGTEFRHANNFEVG